VGVILASSQQFIDKRLAVRVLGAFVGHRHSNSSARVRCIPELSPV